MIGSKLGQVLSNAAGTESIVRQFGLSVHEATVASPLITGTSADNLKKYIYTVVISQLWPPF